MTDLTVVAANVRPLDGSRTRGYDLGAAAAPGDAYYIASDDDIEKADANGAAALQKARGLIVALEGGKSSGVAGDRATGCVFGPVAGFTGLTPGAIVYLSDTVGKLSDTPGTNVIVMGYCESATVVFVQPEMDIPASS
jgi:hypothetical protein